MNPVTSGKTKVLAVIGHPIAHSLSPAMHNAALRALELDFAYVPFDVPPDMLAEAVLGIRSLGIVGVNVTIPHKEKIIDYLDEVSEEAARISSVNTVCLENGRLKGYSTDGVGFLGPLRSSGFGLKGVEAVILGAGGSAKAVAYALTDSGAQIAIINRTPERGAALAEQINAVTSKKSARSVDWSEARRTIREAALLVNCTSVGMYPNIADTPCPKEMLHPGLLVYDLVYNPPVTRLLKEAGEIGAKTLNGVKMLVHQGAESFKIWLNREPPLDVMEQQVISALNRR